MDAAGYSAIAAGISALVAIGALIYAHRSAGAAKESADAAKDANRIATQALSESRRAAIAGEKSAEAADRAASEAKRSADADEESNRIDKEAFEASRPRDVDFRIERLNDYKFRLHNVGEGTATNVVADASRVPCDHEDLPDGVSIHRNGVHDFVMVAQFNGGLIPSALYLTWDGQSEPVAVPIEH